MKNAELVKYIEKAPLVILCTNREFEKPEHMLECLGDVNCSLLFFYAEDWNRDYSPWQMENPVGTGDFSGGAPETLKRLETDINELDVTYSFGEKIIAGYSLAGLFSLWTALNSPWVNGCVCASGTLWFKDFKEYALNSNPKCKKFYLSLGGKEKNVSDPTMAGIEDRTKEMWRILTQKAGGRNTHFELNPGGHFADSCKRLAKGINWILVADKDKK